MGMLQRAIDKVNELINMDMGSLVEDKKDKQRVISSLLIVRILPQTYISGNGLRRKSLLASRVSEILMFEQK